MADPVLGPLSRVDHAFLDVGTVVSMHQHRNDEILSYMWQGLMVHEDSTGQRVELTPSRLMMMNAGRGFSHEESTPSVPVEMLQIFIRPQATDLDPSVQFHERQAITRGEWTHLGGPLRAARQAGARRFIASDYSMNLFTVPEGDNVSSDARREFARRADGERGDVEVVHVLNGAFLDRRVLFGFLGAVNLQKREAYRWGDGHAEMQFTTYDDTAAYTAAAALDDRSVPDKLFVAGDSLSFDRLVKEVEAGLGAPITVKSLGSFSDLDAEIKHRYAAEPANIPAWLPQMYWRAMLNGTGRLGPLMNDRYPDIRPTGVREYVSRLATERAPDGAR